MPPEGTYSDGISFSILIKRNALMDSYRTVSARASAEITVKKSRFLSQIAPVCSAEAAAAFVAERKTAHWNAAHNVWAYALREGQLRRYSDDGEPQGTAGLPTLEVLQREELTDCALVVTRYFGGILLGASGLVRAYAQAAKAALDAAADAGALAVMTLCRTLLVRCDYSLYGRLAALAPEQGAALLDTAFAEDVTLTLRIRAAEAARLAARLTDASNGRAAMTWGEEGFAAE
jgi:uncharacterized YigZ family protein